MTRLIDAGSPWAKLPSELAPLMRAQVPGVTAQILSRIQEEIPEYSRPLDGPFGHAITNGIEHALIQFVHRVADPQTPLDPCAEMYRRLGCGEFREGRSLDTLQAAYRLGARIAWRSMSEFGEQVQLSTATMRALGEAVFEHIDDLAALAVEGYLAAQAKASGSRERRRRRLLELILAEPPTPRQVISELADAVDWPLPVRVHVVALDPSGVPEPWLDGPILADLEGPAPHLLVPEGIELDEHLGEVLHGGRAAVGPLAALEEAAESLRWARRALQLARDGVLPDEPILRCSEHLASLWLVSEAFLRDALIRKRLAPLDPLTPRQWERLAETLLAWLETRSGAPGVASRLGIHPQTVRYRLHQLEDLFGSDLNDPDTRFELEVALRADRLARGDKGI
ncbi:helix-turn-helix domain-containing protein [Allokutzneria albata]|uniref:PucR C-terminal helix-turn-helix domain-containing protein n=1 Tax=Allokutzneria albata TaxID=211114 RepID=A0A1G9UQX4_ALLAB|nr:PucR family transcriptional regulator [Allokutzneria albata]SDM62368.1 PucR C-terminal helix-turn-helix domain-containing protein [Allokutzneria albata]